MALVLESEQGSSLRNRLLVSGVRGYLTLATKGRSHYVGWAQWVQPQACQRFLEVRPCKDVRSTSTNLPKEMGFSRHSGQCPRLEASFAPQPAVGPDFKSLRCSRASGEPSSWLQTPQVLPSALFTGKTSFLKARSKAQHESQVLLLKESQMLGILP